ncbi:MAG: hypothetical protein AB7S75_09940 [Desulfococcaceae bacterium]
MQLYEICLQPLSGFGTPLKGDTIFGQFCWQLVRNPDLLKKGNPENCLKTYPEKPFVIFSSAFPKGPEGQYILKKPDLPSFMFPLPRLGNADDLAFFSSPQRGEAGWGEKQRPVTNDRFHPPPAPPSREGSLASTALPSREESDTFHQGREGESKPDCQTRQKNLKSLKKKKWMVLSSLRNLKLSDLNAADLHSDEELSEIITKGKESFIRSHFQSHNTIHRMTNTTLTDRFAPYVIKNMFYCPEMKLRLFFMADEEILDAGQVAEGLKRMGQWGYGRDASLGLGRFSVGIPEPVQITTDTDADAFYTLGPCVPEKGSFAESWFTPFVRFGRHGDSLATSSNPFKAPVVMADEGAVFRVSDPAVLQNRYAGRAVENVSVHENIMVQGYAPVLPLHLGGIL